MALTIDGQPLTGPAQASASEAENIGADLADAGEGALGALDPLNAIATITSAFTPGTPIGGNASSEGAIAPIYTPGGLFGIGAHTTTGVLGPSPEAVYAPQQQALPLAPAPAQPTASPLPISLMQPLPAQVSNNFIPQQQAPTALLAPQQAQIVQQPAAAASQPLGDNEPTASAAPLQGYVSNEPDAAPLPSSNAGQAPPAQQADPWAMQQFQQYGQPIMNAMNGFFANLSNAPGTILAANGPSGPSGPSGSAPQQIAQGQYPPHSGAYVPNAPPQVQSDIHAGEPKPGAQGANPGNPPPPQPFQRGSLLRPNTNGLQPQTPKLDTTTGQLSPSSPYLDPLAKAAGNQALQNLKDISPYVSADILKLAKGVIANNIQTKENFEDALQTQADGLAQLNKNIRTEAYKPMTEILPELADDAHPKGMSLLQKKKQLLNAVKIADHAINVYNHLPLSEDEIKQNMQPAPRHGGILQPLATALGYPKYDPAYQVNEARGLARQARDAQVERIKKEREDYLKEAHDIDAQKEKIDTQVVAAQLAQLTKVMDYAAKMLTNNESLNNANKLILTTAIAAEAAAIDRQRQAILLQGQITSIINSTDEISLKVQQLQSVIDNNQNKQGIEEMKLPFEMAAKAQEMYIKLVGLRPGASPHQLRTEVNDYIRQYRIEDKPKEPGAGTTNPTGK